MSHSDTQVRSQSAEVRNALFLSSAFCLLTWAVPSHAATFYVRVNGAGTSCTQAQTDSASTAINDVYTAMRCLYAGDTLLIHAGTYYPQAPNGGGSDNISSHFYGTSANRITLKAFPGETVIFEPAAATTMAHAFDYYDPNPSPGAPEFGSYVTYDGFIFNMFSGNRNTDCPGPAGGGGLACNHAYASAFRFEENTGSYSIIQNCEIKNFVTSAFMHIGHYSQFLNNYVHDYVPYTPANQQICRNAMGYDCWSVGGYDYSSYSVYRGNVFKNLGVEGFQYWDTTNPNSPVQGKVFDRNYWVHNGFQINTDGTSRLGAALVNGTNGGGVSPIIITNNVFDDNTTVMAYPSNNTIFANNTVVNNQQGLLDGIGTNGVIKNNIFYGNGSDVALSYSPAVFTNNICGNGGCPAGNQNGVNPRFTSGVSGSVSNFQLQSNSPAINAGVTVSQVTTDYAGAARPQGSAYDIGAYEFGGTMPSPCDVNGSGATNVSDVQLCANQAIGAASCTADINNDGQCNVIDVQRVVNAALGGPCVAN